MSSDETLCHPLHKAALGILLNCTTEWGRVADHMTATHEEAFAVLIKAGLLEGRIIVEAMMLGSSIELRAVCRVSCGYERELLRDLTW